MKRSSGPHKITLTAKGKTFEATYTVGDHRVNVAWEGRYKSANLHEERDAGSVAQIVLAEILSEADREAEGSA